MPGAEAALCVTGSDMVLANGLDLTSRADTGSRESTLDMCLDLAQINALPSNLDLHVSTTEIANCPLSPR